MNPSNMPAEAATIEYWHQWAWWGCIIICTAFTVWYIMYCIKLCKPHKSFRLFSQDINDPLDTDLSLTILLRALMLIAAVLSCYVAIIYAITNYWMVSQIPFGIRIATGIGSIYLLFIAKKAAVNAIHNQLKDKKNKVEIPAEPVVDPNQNQNN